MTQAHAGTTFIWSKDNKDANDTKIFAHGKMVPNNLSSTHRIVTIDELVDDFEFVPSFHNGNGKEKQEMVEI